MSHMTRGLAWAVVLALLIAVPARAEEEPGNDLGVLLLIGDESYGETDIAGAFARLVDDGHFKVPNQQLKTVDPKDIPDEQIDDLSMLCYIARVRATRWEQTATHHQHAFALLTTVHDIAKAVRERKPKNVAAHLAYAESLAALTLERINRRDSVKFAETFEAAANVCFEAAKLEDKRVGACAVHGSQLLRVALRRAGTRQHEVLDRALRELDKAASDHPSLRAERARVHLASSQLHLREKKKGDAKKAYAEAQKAIAAALDLKAHGNDPNVTGAFNDLIAFGMENKWAPKGAAFEMEAREEGGFAFEFPRGAGWHEGNEGNLKGKGRFLLQRLRPDNVWVKVGLASFDVELGYGEGDVPGSKPKAILQMTKQVWQGVMKKPTSGKLGNKELPADFKGIGGYVLTGRSKSNVLMTVFAWGAKSDKFTYVFTAVLEGKHLKKLPPQAAAILKSVKPK